MARLRIRKVLKKKGISIKQFARMTQTDYSSMSRDTRPTSNPTLLRLTRWARLLKCKVRDLLEE